jgi:hypothetical protein
MSSEPVEVHHLEMKDDLIVVTADVSILEEEIQVLYAATARETPLWLGDISRHDNEGRRVVVEPERAYVTFEDPGTIALRKTTPRRPRLKSVPVAWVHAARQLRKDKAIEGKISVPLPAEEYNPYYPPWSDRVVYRRELAHALRLVLEYSRPIEVVRAVEVEDLPGAFLLRSPCEDGQVEASVPLAKPVVVKRRSDQFEPV